MPANNPFESPQSEVTQNRAPTVRPSTRIIRAVSLGILGYAIFAGVVYLSALSFGSESNIPATVWMLGIYTGMAFAGSELFANARRRSFLRRLAYSLSTIFLSAILANSFIRQIPDNSFFPVRAPAGVLDVQVVFDRTLVIGLFFVACATVLNLLRPGSRVPEELSTSAQDDEI